MSSSASRSSPGSLLDDDRALLEELAGVIDNARLEALADVLEELHRNPQLDELGRDDRELLVEFIETVERPRLDVDESDRLDDDPARYKRSTLPTGKLPTFGEAGEDCGELIPEAMYYCDCCYDVKEFPHNCYKFDCPMHGLHAVRRHAAGGNSEDFPGRVPKLGAVRAVLDRRRTVLQVYNHWSMSPPPDYFWRSDDPLNRFFQLGRELMNLI